MVTANADDLDPHRSFLPPPPQYAEAAQIDSKNPDNSDYVQAPWLLCRTSITIESKPFDSLDDGWSSIRESKLSRTRGEFNKGAIRSLLTRFGNRQAEEIQDDGRSMESVSIMSQPYDSVRFGTTVSIEAGHPTGSQTQRRYEMRGLEQAASVKRFAGSGSPAEAWGKLMKDPELWDPAGDTLVYFSYQRPQASFRVRSSILEETKSDVLISKLHDGYKRTPKPQSFHPPTASPLQGIKNLGRENGNRRPELGSETQIRYEIHFPVPQDASRMDILRYHVTTRNLFALLYNKPFVGLTFYQGLIDLHERLKLYMPKGTNCALMINNLLIKNCLHNVCNDPAAAAGLLSWSEDLEVRWNEGWREGFVHCSGMYTGLKTLPEFRDLSTVSRTLLERSHLELQARIQEAQKRLSNFKFGDIWSGSHNQSPDALTSFSNYSRFLQQHYERTYKHWPPQGPEKIGGNWLTRNVVSNLQKDFGALYEYYVDRDVIWDDTNVDDESSRKMILKTNGAIIETKNDHLSLAKIFVRFDDRQKYHHIPHPYPLLPTSVSAHANATQQMMSLFSSKNKTREKRTVHAYPAASNSHLLGLATNGLVKAFMHFEKTDHLSQADPREARRGWWILLYAILQVLASLSVDTPGLCFTDNVSYFLNPRLKGSLPWTIGANGQIEEASPTASYCWKFSESQGERPGDSGRNA